MLLRPAPYSAASSSADFTCALATGICIVDRRAARHRRGCCTGGLPRVGIDARTHGCATARNALHRPAHQRSITDQRAVEALPGQQAHQQSHRRAGIAHVERSRRQRSVPPADAVHPHLASADRSMRTPSACSAASVARQSSLARKPLISRVAVGDAAEHQRAMRDRLVAGNARARPARCSGGSRPGSVARRLAAGSCNSARQRCAAADRCPAAGPIEMRRHSTGHSRPPDARSARAQQPLVDRAAPRAPRRTSTKLAADGAVQSLRRLQCRLDARQLAHRVGNRARIWAWSASAASAPACARRVDVEGRPQRD